MDQHPDYHTTGELVVLRHGIEFYVLVDVHAIVEEETVDEADYLYGGNEGRVVIAHFVLPVREDVLEEA